MNLLQEAFAGGVVVGWLVAIIMNSSIQIAKEVIKEMRSTKKA